MFDLRAMRQDPEHYVRGVARKEAGGVEEILDLDRSWRAQLAGVEELRARRNAASQEIAQKKRAGEDASGDIAAMREIGARIREIEEGLKDLEPRIRDLIARLPNIPHESVPDGDATHNLELRRVGTPRRFTFTPKAHWDLGVELGMVDFERASKVSGPRFAFLTGAGARLERALVSFMLDMHTEKHGYTELFPPFLVNDRSAFGTAQLPKFANDMFQTTDGYFLIPTAEVPVTNYRREEILAADELPLRYCAYSACFRSEAGSAGRDTRGLIRNHQFNKVELVRLATEERSYDELEILTKDAEDVLEALELPYRVVVLSTLEMTSASAKTYDLEVWLPSYNTYREISSCSNFEAYQARRAEIRYRDADGRLHYAHTLNGSGVAVGRAWAAIVENYQEEDGSLVIPDALRPYMGGLSAIRPQEA